MPCTNASGQMMLPDQQVLLAGSDATNDREQEKGGRAAQGSINSASSTEERDRSRSPGKAAAEALQAVSEGNLVPGLIKISKIICCFNCVIILSQLRQLVGNVVEE